MSRVARVPLRVAALAATLVVAAPAAAWSPAVNYALNCQGCHLADGSATQDLVPPLRGSVGRLVRVPEGRAYLVRLPNIASTPLSDDETAALLNWVVERFGASERPIDFPPFTAAEIARQRHDVLIDVEAERRAVLAAVAAADDGPADGLADGPAGTAAPARRD